jgi:hypothetical protein
MPGARAIILVAATIAALFAISGCGGGDDGVTEIPPDAADQMLATTQQIQEASDAENCDEAQSATTDLRGQVDDLEEGKTKQSLSAMVTRLDQNLDNECADTGTTDEAPEPEEEPTTSVPVEPSTTTSTTETTTSVPEETEPPEQPPGEGGGSNGPPQTPPGQDGGGPPTGGLEGDE